MKDIQSMGKLDCHIKQISFNSNKRPSLPNGWMPALPCKGNGESHTKAEGAKNPRGQSRLVIWNIFLGI